MLTVRDLRTALDGLPDEAPLVLGIESEDASAEDLAEMVGLELVDVGSGLGGLMLQVRVHLEMEDGGSLADGNPLTEEQGTRVIEAVADLDSWEVEERIGGGR